jgi:PKD repeat protein
VLENEGQSKVLSQGSFEKYLADRYERASHYYAVCHPSAPNYLALTSGTPWQCGSDGYSVYSTENLGDLLEKANVSWADFDESMPKACDTNNSYPYMVKHDPFVYYSDLVGNSSLCDSHVLPLTAWTGDVANGTIPNFAFFTPNMLDDGHDTNVSYADHWLRGFLSPLLNDSWFNDSAWFVTYDESAATDSSGYNTTQGGNVYFAAASPFVPAHSTYATNASHYTLLATIEWLLGLNSTGHHDGTSEFPAMRGLFDFPTTLTLAANASRTAGLIPLTVNFTANASGGVAPYTYAWNFSDGHTSASANVSQTFRTPGVYNVTVTVRDGANHTAAYSFLILAESIRPGPLTATVSARPTVGVAPLDVSFASNVSGGVAPYNVSWDFGDGTTAADRPNVTHRYAGAGNFSVVAVVTDPAHDTQQASTGVMVCLPETVGLLAPTGRVDAGSEVDLAATVSGAPGWGRVYSWSLNGSALGNATPSIGYRATGNGTYVFGVSVRDACGQNASASAPVTVGSSSTHGPGGNGSGAPGGGAGGTLPGWNRSAAGLPLWGWVVIAAAIAAALGTAALLLRARRRRGAGGPPAPP